MARVFISYTARQPDQSLGKALYNALKDQHHVFFAEGELRWGQNWEDRIIEELKACDYFLVLLSEQSIASEMVSGEVRKARNRLRQEGKPVIFPLRLNLPFDLTEDYELNSYLHRIQQKTWSSPDDTPGIVAELQHLIGSGEVPELLPEDTEPAAKASGPPRF